MRLALFAVVVLVARPPLAAADDDECSTTVRLIELGGPCDITIVPFNMSAGYAAIVDELGVSSGAVLGADLLSLTWRSVFVTAQIRLALYPPARGEPGADVLVGGAAGYVVHLDAARHHNLVIGAAAGWGMVGTGRPGAVGSGDGGLVVSPFVRYAFLGAFGIEVHALLPATGEINPRYPAAVAISLIGLPLLLVGLFGDGLGIAAL